MTDVFSAMQFSAAVERDLTEALCRRLDDRAGQVHAGMIAGGENIAGRMAMVEAELRAVESTALKASRWASPQSPRVAADLEVLRRDVRRVEADLDDAILRAAGVAVAPDGAGPVWRPSRSKVAGPGESPTPAAPPATLLPPARAPVQARLVAPSSEAQDCLMRPLTRHELCTIRATS